MFGKNKAESGGPPVDRSYDLDWPGWYRWNPRYQVPRNSLESVYLSYPSASKAQDDPDARRDGKPPVRPVIGQHGPSRRDWDTVGVVNERYATGEAEELSHLTHWLGTLGEVYMNELDRRARFEPRWLNVTRRERFSELTSATITFVDYLAGDAPPQKTTIGTMKEFAGALQACPDTCQMRVVVVSDLDRFVMGTLGQLFSVDPEFWYEHLANSGYGSSDSGLKLKNAGWMNWVGRETQFRHNVLPGTGQRTEWNVPRRTRRRCWAHIRWGRLGVLNYLGRKGFHEDEMEQRLKDGRWTMERDVALNKHGLLMTSKRWARAAKKEMKKNKRKAKEKAKTRAKTNLPPPPRIETAPARTDGITTRSKTTNIYRPYTTFENLPNNAEYWDNRDLRVVAPEGLSYWQGQDDKGRKTIILLIDPMRTMEHQGTKEQTPSLTFMPRIMEIESYNDEERWRSPSVGETYLDPSSPLFSNEELKRRKQEAKKKKQEALRRNRKSKKDVGRGGAPNTAAGPAIDQNPQEPDEADDDSVSSFTSDSEYDEEYQAELRSGFKNPLWHSRRQDFARKYSLTTHDLVLRYMTDKMTTTQVIQEEALVPSLLTQLSLDDTWQLLAEIRMDLDHLSNGLASDLHLHLLESRGISIRLNVSWMCSTLHQLREWLTHLATVPALSHPADLSEEIAEVIADLESIYVRAGKAQEILAGATALAQSTLVIDQTSGINKLTELAFFFVPLSFITSVFSMQVIELTSRPPPMWSWGVAIVVVLLVTYFVRILLRSPTMRSFMIKCRVVILNRFSSSTPRSASHRLHTVGNRAIAKFLVYFTILVITIFPYLAAVLFLYVLVFGGASLAGASVALYFIITRWPEPTVLGPCFAALVVAAGGAAASWYWYTEINDWLEPFLLKFFLYLPRIFPEGWSVYRVDDDDLATEGIHYSNKRQAILLATS